MPKWKKKKLKEIIWRRWIRNPSFQTGGVSLIIKEREDLSNPHTFSHSLFVQWTNFCYNPPYIIRQRTAKNDMNGNPY